MGDVVGTTTTMPGNYTVTVPLSFGHANTFNTTTSFTQQVEGRCGRNMPVAAFVLPANAAPDTTLTVKTTGNGPGLDTFDPDNAVLDLTAPTTGCGLNQTLTYAWAFTSTPDPLLHFEPNSGSPGFFGTASIETFTPTVDGVYSVQLVATDDSPVPLQGSAEQTVTVAP
ncbi:MAG: hypothetical protein E6J64_12705 [Deltaproteobacteria bacterium]|nr:MAG: hypothetical protein E6J64_12705 [Deltaproteobacteria bacterium]